MTYLIDLTPKQGYDRLQKNKDILFLDVRSYAEYKFVGHPIDSILLAWIDEPDWTVNPQFCQLVKELQPLDTEIILICRSGQRSMDAGIALIREGFNNVSHIDTGFEGDLDENNQRGNLNGWRYDSLPWEQC